MGADNTIFWLTMMGETSADNAETIKVTDTGHLNEPGSIGSQLRGEASSQFRSITSTRINERKLLRKLDWHLLPFFSFLFLLSFLDSE